MDGVVNRHLFKGPFTTKRQSQRCDNSAMTLAILFSLKTMELLENRLRPYSGVTPLFSIRTESLVSSQSCRRIDADAWCKRGLKCLLFRMILTIFSRTCSSRATYLLTTVSVGMCVCVSVCMYVCMYVCGQLQFNFKYSHQMAYLVK